VEPEVAQARFDQVLRGLLVAEQARNANEVGEELDRVIEAALDRTPGVR
jgi:hypothetical protein